VTILISDANILIEKEVITLNTAYEAYKFMYASGRRLPWKQVWKRFKT
jgi:hypothetical protein